VTFSRETTTRPQLTSERPEIRLATKSESVDKLVANPYFIGQSFSSKYKVALHIKMEEVFTFQISYTLTTSTTYLQIIFFNNFLKPEIRFLKNILTFYTNPPLHVGGFLLVASKVSSPHIRLQK
jgi:hypothetical protein